MTGRVFGLDALRATAIALVVLAHCAFLVLPVTGLAPLRPWLMLGHLGVELFFVLSGYLIGAILIDSARAGGHWIGAFWKRRWLRTLPAYYLFLAINVLIERWVTSQWPDAWRYVVFAQNLAWPQPMFFIESWSLAVEELFYLVAPLLMIAMAPLARRSSPAVVLFCGIVLLNLVRLAAVLAFDLNWDEEVRKVSAMRLDAIAYGVLAVLLDRDGWFTPRRAHAIAFGGAILLALSVFLYLVLDVDRSVFARTLLFSMFSIAFAAWLPAAARWQGRALPRAIKAPVARLALWSYSLYLTHLTVMRVLVLGFGWRAESFSAGLAQSVVCVALAVAAAAFVYRRFERPWLQFRDRWVPRTDDDRAASESIDGLRSPRS